MQFWQNESYKTASWVIAGSEGKALMETFNQKLIDRLKPEFRAIPALDYLGCINKRIAAGLSPAYKP